MHPARLTDSEEGTAIGSALGGLRDRPTYDAVQMGATLTYCLICLRWFYLTHPKAICVACARPPKGAARR